MAFERLSEHSNTPDISVYQPIFIYQGLDNVEMSPTVYVSSGTRSKGYFSLLLDKLLNKTLFSSSQLKYD